MNFLERFQNNRNALGWAFMLPAAVLLLLFLTYPLGLGTWLGFTDAKIGRSGEWIGLENFPFLMGDSVTRLALFNTVFYTVVASILKFVLGLWLAILLNKNLPFKSFFRAVVLLPDRADGPVGHRLLVDLRLAVLGDQLGADEAGLDQRLHRFPRRPVERALVDHRRQRVARHPLRGHLAAGRAADHLALVLRGLGAGRRHGRGSSSAM